MFLHNCSDTFNEIQTLKRYTLFYFYLMIMFYENYFIAYANSPYNNLLLLNRKCSLFRFLYTCVYAVQ